MTKFYVLLRTRTICLNSDVGPSLRPVLESLNGCKVYFFIACSQTLHQRSSSACMKIKIAEDLMTASARGWKQGKEKNSFFFLSHRPRSRTPCSLRLHARRFLKSLFSGRVVSSQQEKILNNSYLQLTPILVSTSLLRSRSDRSHAMLPAPTLRDFGPSSCKGDYFSA